MHIRMSHVMITSAHLSDVNLLMHENHNCKAANFKYLYHICCMHHLWYFVKYLLQISN